VDRKAKYLKMQRISIERMLKGVKAGKQPGDFEMMYVSASFRSSHTDCGDTRRCGLRQGQTNRSSERQGRYDESDKSNHATDDLSLTQESDSKIHAHHHRHLAYRGHMADGS
jgi:hypothetical protein